MLDQRRWPVARVCREVRDRGSALVLRKGTRILMCLFAAAGSLCLDAGGEREAVGAVVVPGGCGWWRECGLFDLDQSQRARRR